ncbi:ferredoxin [Roseibium sp. TrichSKD4]|uniref:2Fe-2S iron-sulfur cluster-binding protein n=1 Tax=Roseibium sp. TrichSKD4 TaxID=744980 RepID=UPI0001E5758D|nr:2Fe-2S iron-sulfur cluster-binding protein [Roseibium sp. TrichSKD4]EFO30883.1 ferredoxin [Roseibium sp. TrichSKD4]
MSGSRCTFTVNGEEIQANVGDTLVEAALGGRIVLPHDCCTGTCETCRVRVVSGEIDDIGTAEKGTVLGCLSVLQGDAEITFDPVPLVSTIKGKVETIRDISPGYLEVRVRMEKKFTWLAGQYIRATFAGFPSRDYSPTTPLALDAEEDVLLFHIKIYPNSIVSSQFNNKIKPGHDVKIKGPFGNGFIRNQPEPMLLTSTGTGFAPIWAIAVSAVLGQPSRELKMIVGARETEGLYMKEAIRWLRNRGVDVLVTASDGDGAQVLTERPYELIQGLTEDHVVYSAGAPSHVEATRQVARMAGATFYADPFFVAEKSSSLSGLVSSFFSKLKSPFSPPPQDPDQN